MGGRAGGMAGPPVYYTEAKYLPPLDGIDLTPRTVALLITAALALRGIG